MALRGPAPPWLAVPRGVHLQLLDEVAFVATPVLGLEFSSSGLKSAVFEGTALEARLVVGIARAFDGSASFQSAGNCVNLSVGAFAAVFQSPHSRTT